MKIPVDAVSCSLHWRKGGGTCLRYRVEHSRGAAPLFFESRLVSHFRKGQVTCVASMEDVVLDVQACAE